MDAQHLSVQFWIRKLHLVGEAGTLFSTGMMVLIRIAPAAPLKGVP